MILAATCCMAQGQVTIEQSQVVKVSTQPETTKPMVAKADPSVVPVVSAQQWKPGDPEPNAISLTVPTRTTPRKNNNPAAVIDVNPSPQPNMKIVQQTITPEHSPIEVLPQATKAKEEDK